MKSEMQICALRALSSSDGQDEDELGCLADRCACRLERADEEIALEWERRRSHVPAGPRRLGERHPRRAGA